MEFIGVLDKQTHTHTHIHTEAVRNKQSVVKLSIFTAAF